MSNSLPSLSAAAQPGVPAAGNGPSSSGSAASTSTSSSSSQRGAFIVFEGLDRSGKSTQCLKLVDNLNKSGVKAKGIRFPDRTTTTGKMIDSYLKQSSELDDHAVHLLFAVNRWEKAKSILEDLQQGTTVVCDRYAFSGAAFSAAKGLDYTWCKSPDVGLPLPDLTCFLSVSPDVAAARGGFGEERYESREMQAAVRRVFATIAGEVGPERWKEVDADGTMEDVERELLSLAQALLVQEGRPAEVGQLWR